MRILVLPFLFYLSVQPSSASNFEETHFSSHQDDSELAFGCCQLKWETEIRPDGQSEKKNLTLSKDGKNITSPKWLDELNLSNQYVSVEWSNFKSGKICGVDTALIRISRLEDGDRRSYFEAIVYSTNVRLELFLSLNPNDVISSAKMISGEICQIATSRKDEDCIAKNQSCTASSKTEYYCLNVKSRPIKPTKKQTNPCAIG